LAGWWSRQKNKGNWWFENPKIGSFHIPV
jgi:hypothetical protein